MTRFILLPTLLLSGLMTACDCGCFDAPVAQVPAASVVTPVTLTWEVRGMTCGGCANAIQNKVAKVDGVESCTVSHEDALTAVRRRHRAASSWKHDLRSRCNVGGN